jgi:hypothetical protein
MYQQMEIPLTLLLSGCMVADGEFSAMDYMGNTVNEMIEKGYAVVSINYRYSCSDKFRAQI